MEIAINYEYREADVANIEIEELARFVIESEGKPETTEVSINFVDNESIKQLNNDFRGVDLITDVLSFECDGADDDDFRSDGNASFNIPYELGDIVIAPDVAELQALDYGATLHDEVCLLITHGLLHLCGYDHMEEDEASRMEARERALLSEFLGREFNL